jgi:hypothetical protein
MIKSDMERYSVSNNRFTTSGELVEVLRQLKQHNFNEGFLHESAGIDRASHTASSRCLPDSLSRVRKWESGCGFFPLPAEHP